MLVAVQLFVPGLYLPPVLKFTLVPRRSAPDDHFTADPDCRVTASGSGRVGCAGGYPTIRTGIVFAAGVPLSSLRPKRSFHCRSKLPCEKYRAEGAFVVLVAVQLSVLGLYLPPLFAKSTPNDHFTAGPDGRVTVSGRGRVGRARGCPLVCARRIARVGNFRKSVDNLP